MYGVFIFFDSFLWRWEEGEVGAEAHARFVRVFPPVEARAAPLISYLEFSCVSGRDSVLIFLYMVFSDPDPMVRVWRICILSFICFAKLDQILVNGSLARFNFARLSCCTHEKKAAHLLSRQRQSGNLTHPPVSTSLVAHARDHRWKEFDVAPRMFSFVVVFSLRCHLHSHARRQLTKFPSFVLAYPRLQ